MDRGEPLLVTLDAPSSPRCKTNHLRHPLNDDDDDDDDELLLNQHNASRLEFFPDPEAEVTGCRSCSHRGGRKHFRSAVPLASPVANNNNNKHHHQQQQQQPRRLTGETRTARAGSNGSATFELCDRQRCDDAADDDLPLLQDENGHHVHNHHGEEDTDHCHVDKSHSKTNRARNQLLISSVLCLLFMIAEILGGYFSNSLAIMTDAAHLLSDLGSFLISLFALWVGSRPPSRRMSFGYHRAEIIGAVLSVLIIWVLTGVLIYLAVKRVIDQDYEIQADTMLIVAGVGVLMNILMGFVLNSLCHCHTHSHGLGQSHDHEHSHSSQANINVRAAFIHVVGDLIQSIGVFIAALIIKFKPEWHLADPICTFLFSILVLFTTATIIRDAVYVLMEGFPKDLSYRLIKTDLQSIEGVKMAHSLHIWSLTIEKNALVVHLALEPDVNNHQILKNALNLIRQKYKIYHSTIQTEPYDPHIMTKCTQCLEPSS